ncbi:phytase [Paraglaciecola hydrolytica]|uniref:3-phytase n=1 Tax=Paraglaciecola hydrolytica TaxID=1799789 RepID=A0A136A3J9_9ALTE|nr:phytase [Paraglaciecola hydrolytica]KXI29818.1 3-phytase [Paraglaciecola hydrolytica]
MKTTLGGLVLLTGVLAGCTANQQAISNDKTTTETMQLSLQDFAVNQNIAGKVAFPIRHQQQNYWLLTSETQGLLLSDASGKTLSQFAGNFEMLDWRANVQIEGKQHDLIATVDKESGKVVILGLDWQTQQFSLLDSFSHPAGVETVCWYTLPQGHSSLFIADDHAQVTQRIIVDGNTQQLSDVVLRNFVGVPEVKSCAVDEQSHSLYLVESNIGLWRYKADPEAELIRELVIATDDFGPLEGELTSVNVLPNGDLLLSTPEQQGIWLIDGQQKPSFYGLPKNTAVENTIGLVQNDAVLLGLYDDESGNYYKSSLKIPLAPALVAAKPFAQLPADGETTPVDSAGDAADDPAIWVNSQQPEHSRILATNKKRGLMVHNLQGHTLQQLDIGRVNNVDLRYGFELNGRTFDIAAASNRTNKSISLFAIESNTGEVSWLNDITTDLNDVYGLCMYQAADKYYVFINDTDGRFQQYLLNNNDSKIGGTLVREFKVASQPEGCVADDINGQLYFGEEARGIWQVAAQPSKSLPRLIAEVGEEFVADVEGMSIYHLDGQRFLVASSQGNNSYGVFALEDNNRYLGSFQISMNLAKAIDGASETDGLDIVSVPLGSEFPHGLLVVQDGHNVMPSDKQNFKLLSGSKLAEFIQNARK